MAIAFVSQAAAGGDTLTMPSHSTGDLILGFGSLEGAAAGPTVPGGWTTIATGVSGDGIGTAAAYKIAASGSETFGTWTDAGAVAVHVYSGADAIGAESAGEGGGTSVDYPALTLDITDSTSWVALFAGHAWGSGSLNAPSGMTNRSNVASGSHNAGGHDSAAGVASYAGGNGTMTSGGFDDWMARAIEILEAAEGGGGGRIMSSLVAAGGLAGRGGIAGPGGGLAGCAT